MPLVAVITALSVVDCLGDTPYLKGVTGLLKSCLKWGTGLLLTLYGAVIAIQSQAAGAFDTVAGKTVKYAVGSFVPVVGGALSDSLEMVGTSARAIKSALGISGIIGVGYGSLSPLINVCAVALSYKLAACLCAVTSKKRESHVIDEVGGSLVRICGVILAVSALCSLSAWPCFADLGEVRSNGGLFKNGDCGGDLRIARLRHITQGGRGKICWFCGWADCYCHCGFTAF